MDADLSLDRSTRFAIWEETIYGMTAEEKRRKSWDDGGRKEAQILG